MRLGGVRRSRNVQDRRGMGGGIVGGGIGVAVIALIVMLLGGDPGAVLEQGGQATTGAPSAAAPSPDDSAGVWVSQVLATTEDAWSEIFASRGSGYEEPTLVLFSGATSSGCGLGQAAMGPFYCPLDRAVYIDLSFYEELRDRLGAEGDFAQAYVIAHEVGHHVQTLLGISDDVRARSQAVGQAEANALSVRQELQADCFAGVWGNRTRSLLDPEDPAEALTAASAIGDDRLQQAAQGYVVPESFTHGTSAQRRAWFQRGFESGDPADCDTFAAEEV
ncbi:MAG TPA: neutral zinc metallopeptidase [Longimicrobiaceae bacterium]